MGSRLPDPHLTALRDAVLGATDAHFVLHSSAEHRLAALSMASAAQRSLHIFSRNLDSAVFDNPEFASAVTQLATRSRYAVVRVLVQDPQRAVQQGHRLIQLYQRLSSRIQLRKADAQFKDYNEAFMIADAIGIIQRRLADRYEGVAMFNAPGEAKRLLKFFNQAWEMSAPDPELRRLHL